MPADFRRSRAIRPLVISAAALAMLASTLAAGAAPRPQPPAPTLAAARDEAATARRSALDGPLFFQLLVGEIELLAGEPAVAFEALLDAARKTGDEQLFRRATDIALRSRAGDRALAAARTWQAALPRSVDAHRYLVQILVALNRPAELAEPLRAWLSLMPAPQRAAAMATLPVLLGRSPDPSAIARMLDQALEPLAQGEGTAAILVARGRAWLAAGDPKRAFQLAREAHRAEATSEAALLLATETIGREPEAQDWVGERIQAQPTAALRLAYARALSGAQRYAEAIAQLEELTRAEPERAAAWLMLGALHLELRDGARATTALETFLRLGESARNAPTSATDLEIVGPSEQARMQAWLMLAQAAEQQGDYARAESWLARVESPQRALEVQQRRASLLARQGRLADARALIRRLPGSDDGIVRARFMAEAQLLRDAKQWVAAREVLAEAGRRFPQDVDLMYEQSMLDERLGRLEEMEALLRRVIALKPDHHHAHNALGYSLAERNLRLDEAKGLIQRALELAPGEPFIIDSLGWVEYRLGNLAEGLRLLQAAYRARPDAEIGAHLGEVLWVSGQREEARRVLREAHARDADNEVLQETLKRLKVDL